MTCGKTAMELHDEARVLRLIQTKHESVVRELETAVEHNAQIGAEMAREAHRQEARAEKAEARVAELESHNHWTKCEPCAREREAE